MLFAIFFWFTGFNAVETFFSLYGQHILGIEPGTSSIVLTSFSLAFLVFAIPAGFVASKLGRCKTILLGIIGALAVFVPLIFIRNALLISVILISGGIFWALININSYPMIVEMAPKGLTGAYTGYYYFFSSTAAIVSPILFGWIKDVVGSYKPLFVYASMGFILAFICMQFVKHGDVKELDEEKIKAIESGP